MSTVVTVTLALVALGVVGCIIWCAALAAIVGSVRFIVWGLDKTLRNR